MTEPNLMTCYDCRRDEEEYDLCDLCSHVICIYCENSHDCVASDLGPDEQSELDEMLILRSAGNGSGIDSLFQKPKKRTPKN